MPELQFQRFRQVRPPAVQRGGTIVGFMVGVVCGLGIAAIAAVMVSRSPVPFMNKTGRSPERLAVPKPGDELPDPNKPLYAKDRQPPTEAPSAETGQPPVPTEGLSILERLFGRAAPEPLPVPPGTEPAASAPGSGAPSVPAQPASPPATPSAPSVAPAAQRSLSPPPAVSSPAKADVRPADPPRQADLPPRQADLPITPEPMVGYVLQAGAFRARDDADGMRVKLALLGFEAKVLPAEVNGQTVYRVRIGPYAQADEMNRMRARLAENGIEATVIRQR
jgi:cell division protein FtsN